MRWLVLVAAPTVAWLAVATPVLADAVDPCPPGFRPSHAGCRFDPRPSDLLVCAGCGAGFLVLGPVGAALAMRQGRSRGPGEGPRGGG
jgi:hypothetical protein